MPWLILILGCECQTIVVSLKNVGIQSSREGIYQRAGKVNGKTSWISSINALWFKRRWLIGPVHRHGDDYGGIGSTAYLGRSSCPYDVPNDEWEKWDGFKWIIADANDVSIECTAFGNLSLLRPLTLFSD